MPDATRASVRTYLDRGWTPFPLQENSKEPNVPEGYWPEDDGAEPEWPEGSYNVGLMTGQEHGFIVLDFDGPIGAATMASLALPETYTVRTPDVKGAGAHPGTHLYFLPPARPFGLRVRAMPGMDLRAEGGYVAAPPSSVAGIGSWSVVRDVPLAPLPEWLDALLRVGDAAAGAGPEVVPIAPDDPSYAAALASAGEYLARAPLSISGEGGQGIFFAVCGVLTRRYLLATEDAARLVTEAYNPRLESAGTEPWVGPDLLRKLDEARGKCTGVDPGFDRGLVAKLSSLAEGRAIVVRREPPARRLPDPGHVYSWVAGAFQSGDKEKLAADEVVATLLSHEAWEGVLQHDQFRDRIRAVNPPFAMDAETTGLSKADAFDLLLWFASTQGVSVTQDTAHSAMVSAARVNGYHPVLEYLDVLPDMPGSIDRLADVLGLGTAIERTCLRAFLLGAVNRIRVPGCKMDNMLVLFGGQGIGKSSFVQALFGEQFTTEDVGNIEDVDGARVLRGKWAIEVSELQDFLRKDPGASKKYVTRRVDTYRLPYAQCDGDYPRTCVFIGTTNDDGILRDSTGERRYWILRIESRIDLGLVAGLRDAIWGEASAALARGEDYHLEALGESALQTHQEEFKSEDPWTDTIRDVLAGRESVPGAETYRALGKPVGQWSQGDRTRITGILQSLGAIKKRSPQGVRWIVPDALRAADPSPAEVRRRAAEGLATRLARN